MCHGMSWSVCARRICCGPFGHGLPVVPPVPAAVRLRHGSFLPLLSRSVPAAGAHPVCGGTLCRAYRVCARPRLAARVSRRRAYRAPDCAGARPRARTGRKAHLSPRFSRAFFAPARTGKGAAPRTPAPSSCSILPPIFRSQALRVLNELLSAIRLPRPRSLRSACQFPRDRQQGWNEKGAQKTESSGEGHVAGGPRQVGDASQTGMDSLSGGDYRGRRSYWTLLGLLGLAPYGR